MLLYEFTGIASNEYTLGDAVEFHDDLNPLLFKNGVMLPEIKEGLIKIAKHFEEFIGVELDVVDITVSGSNAAYSYTPYSDIDLHIVVNVPNTAEYKELLDAKKNNYNTLHDIKVKGIDVELYAQDSGEEHHSLGIYSILNDEWVSKPKKERPEINSYDVVEKYENYVQRIHKAIQYGDLETAKDAWATIRKLRQSGLEKFGEYGTENLAFKLLRNSGALEKLKTHINTLTDKELSVEDWEL